MRVKLAAAFKEPRVHHFLNHAAGRIAEYSDTVITTESCAASANEFVVSPFQMNRSMVGVYNKGAYRNNRPEGFDGYYSGIEYGTEKIEMMRILKKMIVEQTTI